MKPPEEQNFIAAAIAACGSIGPRGFQAITRVFSSHEEAWRAPKQEFRETGLPARIIDQFIAHRASFDIENLKDELEKTDVHLITHEDPEYPPLLREIYDAPPVLYYRGTIQKSHNDSVAIVGTRKITEYGKHVTQEIVSEIARAGIPIVSGLALGVDAIAHQTTVETGGITIAVLGGGVDAESVAPRSNAALAERIIENGGVLVSEYPPYTLPRPEYFPQRNRIIAGITLGTVVTEAPIESGALITAKCAREENREVFAVPGNITYTNSEGTNLLIKLGAHLVSSGQDVLDILGFKTAIPSYALLKITESRMTTTEEQQILDLLSVLPLHVDELLQKSTLAPAILLSTLTSLELGGMVKDIGGKQYTKI